jgi:enoyl-CoA hydratase/carnithine racemase
MSYFRIREQKPFVAVEFNHSPSNCLTPDIMEDLIGILSTLKLRDHSERPRAVVFRSGLNGVFSHGMDPKYFVMSDLEERKRIFVSLAHLMEAFYKFGIPVIADINGPALAGGAVLALLADFATISASSGKICFSETKVGLPVPEVIQDLIRFKVSASACLEAVVLGKNYDAASAFGVGMVNHVYHNDAERDQYINDMCARFARVSPEVIAATINDSKRWMLAGKEKFLDSMDDVFVPFLTDQFLGKGLKALLVGQKPSW